MAYTTFRRAKQMVTRGGGGCEDAELSELVNTIRHHWYNWYLEISLFMDAVECFKVQRFCFDCRDCRESYRGITLPRECQNVQAMWWNDWPVALQSDWREFQTGIMGECDHRLQKFDMPGSYSTALDIRPGMPVKLRVVAQSPADEGKPFMVRGVAGHGGSREEKFALSMEPQETEEAYILVEPRGGVVKDITTGRVVLAEESGRVLGIYEPDETVPSYKRVKITGLPDDCEVVNVRSARRFFPLVGDNDVVETDNEPAFDAMARYLRGYRMSNKTEAQLKEMTINLATARTHILGDQSRDRAKSTRTEVVVVAPAFGGLRLHRTGGRGWR